MMKASDVLKAAKYIEQLERIETLTHQKPSNADSVTITFRVSKTGESKSVTFKDDPVANGMQEHLNNRLAEIHETLRELGVNPDG